MVPRRNHFRRKPVILTQGNLSFTGSFSCAENTGSVVKRDDRLISGTQPKPGWSKRQKGHHSSTGRKTKEDIQSRGMAKYQKTRAKSYKCFLAYMVKYCQNLASIVCAVMVSAPIHQTKRNVALLDGVNQWKQNRVSPSFEVASATEKIYTKEKWQHTNLLCFHILHSCQTNVWAIYYEVNALICLNIRHWHKNCILPS